MIQSAFLYLLALINTVVLLAAKYYDLNTASNNYYESNSSKYFTKFW